MIPLAADSLPARRPARWLMPPDAGGAIDDWGLTRVVARVLWSRGVRDRDAARSFLNPSLADLLDPLHMLGMAQAVERLRRAIAARETVLIYGDYDVDGTTSIVILKKAIELAGGVARFHVPHRLLDGYGMRTDVVERAAAEGVSLIVSVDTGIRAAEAVARAAELGVDVIVTDHHLPEAQLPPALAVLNPNQPGCQYPEKNLCGVGVVFKLVQALLATLGWPRDKFDRTLHSFLKLVAIGTVADVVPLTGENRVIVRHGLAGLNVVKNPGLRALLAVAGLADGAAPSAGQIAFRVAPRINAAGRMSTATDVIELFTTNDPERARALAEQLHALNTERQQTEQEIVRLILDECTRSPVTDSDAALVFAGDGWHRGVLGIVASRLVERFHRPAFVLSHSPEDGLSQGSGRSISCFHLLNALESMPELFVRFGGHVHAAGLTLPTGRVDEFRQRLATYARGLLSPDDFVPTLEVDAVVDLQDLTEGAVGEIFQMAPFGNENATPIFVSRAVEVAGPPSVLKEKHLRVPLRQGGRLVFMKGWNLAERVSELQAGSRVDVAFRIEEDTFSSARGGGAWAAVLLDFRTVPAV